MELLQTFEYGNIKVETYYNGTDKIPNRVYIDNELVLEDKTFRPSPLFNIDDTETMASLLGFYVLTRNDVEEDYFKALDCPELLEWSETSNEADDIRIMLYDFELRDDDKFLEENEIDYGFASRIEQYIFKK